MLNISLPRGDIRNFKIAVKETSGDLTALEFDDIFFTAKMTFMNTDYILQKRLSDGDITKDEEGYYLFSLLPEDTNNLPFGEYDFDIELLKNGAIKQTTLGKLMITPEVTYQSNEE